MGRRDHNAAICTRCANSKGQYRGGGSTEGVNRCVGGACSLDKGRVQGITAPAKIPGYHHRVPFPTKNVAEAVRQFFIHVVRVNSPYVVGNAEHGIIGS